MEYGDEDIPIQLKKLVEMYPLLKKLKFYNPYFFDKTSGGKNKEIQVYIEKTQENLIRELYQNAKKSAVGEGKRKIRPAT
ncbi:MAG: hypothetical protein HWN67_18440, partial [Candidatus Helarchaeota archaeon]|nr:hypothetical protein [Candidatus Helarchaeota archaeon]